MSYSLTQSLTDAQTVFALFVYIASVVAALPVFEIVHEKLEHRFPQTLWDKVGMPVLRSLLLILFLALVFPLNFGLGEVPTLTQVIQADKKRFDALFNLLFLVTFIYPVIPVIGKADAMMIPLQGIIATALIFRWLCQSLGQDERALWPGLETILVMVIVAIAGYFLARYLADVLGNWLDRALHREGYPVLVYQAVIMIMQSPVIFIYGHSLSEQLALR